MIIRCIDFETTGLMTDEEVHAIMEIGYVDLADKRMSRPIGELVNPGRPTSIEARAVHHISDDDVAGAISPTEACLILMEGPHQFFCAHNIDFERKFFGGGERQWICTYKTALRVWPEAPGHKLQELRYFLRIDEDPDFNPEKAERPHRAPDDAYVCAFVLRRLMDEVTIAELVRWSSGPALLHMCFMKKHKNKPWSQVARDDRDYLDWIYNTSDVKDRDIRATVKYWLKQTEGAK